MSTKAKLKFRSAGGSLIATIPKRVVDREGLRPGDVREVTFQGPRSALAELVGVLPDLPPWDRRWTRGRDRF